MFDLYEFKRQYALRGKDVVNYLNRYYPLFDKAAESKASHYDTSGVCLTADAEAVLRTRFEAERYRKRKAYTESRQQIKFRMEQENADKFRRYLEKSGLTAQYILTELVTVWVEAQELAERKMQHERL